MEGYPTERRLRRAGRRESQNPFEKIGSDLPRTASVDRTIRSGRRKSLAAFDTLLLRVGQGNCIGGKGDVATQCDETLLDFGADRPDQGCKRNRAGSGEQPCNDFRALSPVDDRRAGKFLVLSLAEPRSDIYLMPPRSVTPE